MSAISHDSSEHCNHAHHPRRGSPCQQTTLDIERAGRLDSLLSSQKSTSGGAAHGAARPEEYAHLPRWSRNALLKALRRRSRGHPGAAATHEFLCTPSPESSFGFAPTRLGGAPATLVALLVMHRNRLDDASL
jgi:hypothetical protein